VVPMSTTRVYRNSDVLRVAGFIPPGHRHLRLVLVLRDQVVVLHEASVSAIVRAYVNVVAHPTRRAVEYAQVQLKAEERKPGYAEFQLVESGRGEGDIVSEWCGQLAELCGEEAR